MDEPTTYLDIRHQQEVIRTARKSADQGKAVCMVLHDLCLAMKEADQIIVLHKEKIDFAGTPEELFQTAIPKDVFGASIDRFQTEHGWQYFYVDSE
jgi:iron complex transport system ATP-binding protein